MIKQLLQLQYRLPSLSMTSLILSILLTIAVNYYWKTLPDYNLSFAISFSLFFFIPLFYKIISFFKHSVNS